MTAAPDPLYEEAIRAWDEARARRLTAPGGWLTLVDRILLDEGDNEIPIGTITLRAGVPTFRARPGVAVTCEGRPVAERVLRAEEDAPPDTLLAGGRSYELYRRGDAFAVRVKDPEAPARHAFAGVARFPVDPRWRITARFERYAPPRWTVHVFDIGAGLRRQVPGRVHFELEGRALTLEPVVEEDSHRLFFVFADTTNRTETYPAGRFLYAPVPAPEDQSVVLDFNTAFNPPCAFTPHATCPVTPAHNRLPVAVAAGEKRYGEGE